MAEASQLDKSQELEDIVQSVEDEIYNTKMFNTFLEREIESHLCDVSSVLKLLTKESKKRK